MKIRQLFAVMVIVSGILLFVGSAYVMAADFPETIKLEDPSYKHKKGIVEFSHAKHVEEYKAGCGECHHNDKGEALNDLKKGDAVKKCIECHKKPGEIKGKKAKGLSEDQKREYHANALHDNCKGCHKAFNKKNKTKAAPTTCSKCHPKKKK